MLDPDGSNVTPADRLFKRRPDLPNLALTCDNTNTPLPYVDVVNEILELHIAAENGYVDPVTNQAYATSTSYDSTGLTAAELRAVPQNVIAQVYDGALANAVYPFTLPFSPSFAVMRAYLDQLGTSYADVLPRSVRPMAIRAHGRATHRRGDARVDAPPVHAHCRHERDAPDHARPNATATTPRTRNGRTRCPPCRSCCCAPASPTTTSWRSSARLLF